MPKSCRINKNNYVPFRESAYDSIKNMLLKGSLKPGERITESQLCNSLGVSRTPIREAIRRLAAEGLVEVNQKGEASVTNLRRKDLEEIHEIRAVLESFAAERCATRTTHRELEALKILLQKSRKAYSEGDFPKMAQINTTFHNLIYKGARSKRLFKIIETLCTNVTTQRKRILQTGGGAGESLTEHEAILKALERRDKHAAAELVFKHISRAKEILLESLTRCN